MTNEKQEQGDQVIRGAPEKQAIQAPDAQGARNAAASDVKAVQATNRNAHSGSAGGDQLESIQIVALDEGGKQKVVAERPKEAKPQPEITPELLRERAKQPDIWAQKFVADIDKAEKLPAPYRDGQIAQVLKNAEAVYRPKGAADKAQLALDQMDTGAMLAQEVKRNPAAEPVQNLHTWTKQLPEGPEKDRYSQLVREQAAELSPEAKARAERLAQTNERIRAAGLDEGGTHEAIRPEQLVLQGHVEEPENPWQAFNKLTPQQQRGIIKAFEQGGAVGQEAYEQKIEAVSESIPKGFYNVGKGLLDTGLAAATFVIESLKEPEKVPKATKELAGHLAKAITDGVELSQFAAGQAQDMAKTGDYSPAIRAIGFVVETANERWQAMPLEKRTEKGSELIAEMGVGSLIGAWHNLAKSGKLIDALEDIAEKLKDLTGPGRDKAKQAIGKLLEDVLQPKGLTTQGVEMPIPRDIAGKGRFGAPHSPGKGDNYFAMSSEGEGTAFRGDHEPYSRINSKSGFAKSHINEAGDLTPPDPVGLFKGEPVDVVHHLCGSFYKYHKQFSPFTSFSQTGEKITKYGDRYKITADLKALENAIDTGELKGVEIIRHQKVLQMIQESPCADFSKKRAMGYALADKELLIRGVVPKRFLTVEELTK